MLNKNLHKAVLIDVLKGIYADSEIRNTLGLKGGTAAMLFYQLPRFSVDLDFDLLEPKKKNEVFTRLKEILPKYGKVDQVQEKHYTLFFLIDYKKGERNLKVEISKRPVRLQYTVKSYLGIPMLVIKEDDMTASKLAALITRKRFANRDMFDAWFFLANHWSVNEITLKEQTGLSFTQALRKARRRILNIQKKEILSGLGDLLDNKQKSWVKDKLKDELLFQLRLYLSNISSSKAPLAK